RLWQRYQTRQAADGDSHVASYVQSDVRACIHDTPWRGCKFHAPAPAMPRCATAARANTAHRVGHNCRPFRCRQAQRAPGIARRSLLKTKSGSTPPPLFLVFLDNLVVGLDHVILAVGPLRIVGGALLRGVAGSSLTLRLLSLRIQRLTGLAVSTRQLFVRRLDLVHVLAAQRLPRALHSA